MCVPVQVCVELTRVVINRIGSTLVHDLRTTLPPWCAEAVQHLHCANALAAAAVKRDAALAAVMAYVEGSSSSSSSSSGGPFVVTGPSGSGKTTLLAQVANELRAAGDDNAVVVRFAGHTSKGAPLRWGAG